MHREAIGGYPGICRIHRAEIKMLHGQWSEAEQEARQAGEELQRYRLLDGVGYAHYQVGEVRLRMGDLDAAAEAFDRAYEYGHDAQPGLALLQLARGEVADARRSIDRALTAAAGANGVADRATRGRLLPAQVDIALAAGDLEAARQAVEELEIDRRRLRTTALPGRRAHRSRRAAPRAGQGIGGVTSPRAVVASLADVGPALRERPGAPALRRGAGRRGRRGDGPP